MKNIKLFCFLLFYLFFLASCGSSDSLMESVSLNDCFSDRLEHEIAEDLVNLNQTIEQSDNPSFTAMAIIGCYNYQLGNHVLAEQWLKKAFNQSKDQDAKNGAASALGLIYLKELQKEKIKPYIHSARKYYLGRWMMVLYYIDYYRERNHKGYLASAIKELENKHLEEGDTPATKRLLAHMQLINKMEEECVNNPNGEACVVQDLADEKVYLFDMAFGTLYRLLRAQPVRNRQQQQSLPPEDLPVQG